MGKALAWGDLLFCVSVACSTGSSGGGGPAVDASKELSSLSLTELQSLCDWSTQLQGGYGSSAHCEASGIPLETPSNQAQCVAEVMPHYSRPTCTTTVGQWTTCVRWFVANWCSTTPAVHPPGCDAFQTQCYGLPADAGSD
jgi:hypothetical protein